jgi:NAD(P)-dependent dehydrogenase (short-subunit alcohol dehydrogenase family)
MANFLVSSVSRGIGMQISKLLLEHGHVVYGFSRHESEYTKSLLNEERFIFTRIDEYSHDSLETIFRLVDQLDSKIDGIVVVSGGVREIGTLHDLGIVDWNEAYVDNVLPAVLLAKLMFRYHNLSSSNTHFVALGSKVATSPGLFNPHYAAAKGALRTLILHLQNSYGGTQYNFKLLEFASVETEGFRSNLEKFNTKYESLASNQDDRSAQKFLGVEVIASKVLNLLLENSCGMSQLDTIIAIN